MKFNQATDYAFRAVYYLSGLPKGQLVEAKAIAEAEKIPLRFLIKILRSLIAAGIVVSYRGVSGGYALAREPRDITLKDVVEAVEGPVELNRCLVDPSECNKNQSAQCSLHQALFSIRETLNKELAKFDFDTLYKN